MESYIDLSDHELISLLKDGNVGAFDAIYHRHSAGMYKFAYRILKDEDECNDVLQNVFTWLWEHRHNLSFTSLQAYLYAAVKFNLAGVIRVSTRRTEILAEAPVITEGVEDSSLELKELMYLIRSFTESLPEKAREIFELSRNQYLTNKEIASRLGLSEKTVENQMTISLKKLKAHLGRLSFWSVLL